MALKTELHKLIDDCQDDLLLVKAKELLQTADTGDWWNSLDEKDRNLVMESEAEYEKGDFITHANLMEQFEAWKKK